MREAATLNPDVVRLLADDIADGRGEHLANALTLLLVQAGTNLDAVLSWVAAGWVEAVYDEHIERQVLDLLTGLRDGSHFSHGNKPITDDCDLPGAYLSELARCDPCGYLREAANLVLMMSALTS